VEEGVESGGWFERLLGDARAIAIDRCSQRAVARSSERLGLRERPSVERA
jgi:hypothetical protein